MNEITGTNEFINKEPIMYIINYHYPISLYDLDKIAQHINIFGKGIIETYEEKLETPCFMNHLSTGEDNFFVTYEVIY